MTSAPLLRADDYIICVVDARLDKELPERRVLDDDPLPRDDLHDGSPSQSEQWLVDLFTPCSHQSPGSRTRIAMYGANTPKHSGNATPALSDFFTNDVSVGPG